MMNKETEILNRTRILHILEFLRHKSDEQHPVDTGEIIEYLNSVGINAERKAIYKDITALQEFGLNIIKTHTPKNGCFLVPSEFEDIEIELLSDIVASSGLVFQNKAESLLKKLGHFTSDYKTEKMRNTIYVNRANVNENPKIYYIVDSLRRAIDNRKKVVVSYSKYTLQNNKIITTQKEHTVNPYALIWSDDLYYLICNNEKYNNLMHLRVDRIKSITETKEPIRHFSEVSQYKYKFDTADYVKQAFNMFGGEKQRIDLECDKDLLPQMVDKFGKNIFVRPSDNENTFRFSTEALVSEGLLGWIMQFGGGIKIIHPKEVVQQLKDSISLLQDIYK